MISGGINRENLKCSALCVVLISVHFLVTVWTLGPYPALYVDESYFNYPAIRFLEHKGFNYSVSPAAPHGDTIWAYHGVLFPRLQIITFSILGISQFACRLPEYLAAHVAIAFLCIYLVRKELPLTAMLLAEVWFGDHSSIQIRLGRMEGLALLFLALGFAALAEALRKRSWRYTVVSMACTGFAVGFNPSAIGFPMLTAVVLMLASQPRERRKRLFAIITGLLIPFFVTVWFLLPNLGGAMEQFRWVASTVTSQPFSERFTRLFSNLVWARYWMMALLLVSAYNLVRFGSNLFLKRGDGWLHWLEKDSLSTTVNVFTVAGLACVFGSSMHPYYLVYFTIWPIIGLFSAIEAGGATERKKPIVVLLCTIFIITWIPSLVWNLMKHRESFLESPNLSPALFRRDMTRALPAASKVVGSPELLFLSRAAGLDFEPLPWFGRNLTVEPSSYVLLTTEDIEKVFRVSKSDISSRPVIFTGSSYPLSTSYKYPYVLFGPVRDRTSGHDP